MGEVDGTMKRYKLLKDLPTVKAGAIFHRDTNETMQVDMLKRVDDQGIFLPPSFDVSSVHDFDEWFKEINSKITINDIDWNFDPKPGDICYCVDNAGNILSWTHAAEDKKSEFAKGLSQVNIMMVCAVIVVWRGWAEKYPRSIVQKETITELRGTLSSGRTKC